MDLKMQAGSLGPLDQGQKHVGFAWRGQLPGATERARMPGAVTCAGKGSGGDSQRTGGCCRREWKTALPPHCARKEAAGDFSTLLLLIFSCFCPGSPSPKSFSPSWSLWFPGSTSTPSSVSTAINLPGFVFHFFSPGIRKLWADKK